MLRASGKASTSARSCYLHAVESLTRSEMRRARYRLAAYSYLIEHCLASVSPSIALATRRTSAYTLPVRIARRESHLAARLISYRLRPRSVSKSPRTSAAHKETDAAAVSMECVLKKLIRYVVTWMAVVSHCTVGSEVIVNVES